LNEIANFMNPPATDQAGSDGESVELRTCLSKARERNHAAFGETLEGKAAGLAAVRGDSAVFRELQKELLAAPALLSGADPTRHDYYGLAGRLDEAIDAAISNS
jgi:hypothetical protein